MHVSSTGSMRHVTIVEVGPRDGLQNEARIIPTSTKVAFVEALAASGLAVVEATSFVNPRAVPQLADAAEVMTTVRRQNGVRYPVLIPNVKGLERARATGVEAIALFTSASDSFAQANIGTTIDGSFQRFIPIMQQARTDGLWVRGYVSVAFGCPYAGSVAPETAIAVAARLYDLGCHEVALADTIGVATPETVDRLLQTATRSLPINRLALHFHDTAGRAIDNVAAALAHGITVFDAAAGGLGGCPFAPGSPGNVATEAIIEFFEGQSIPTGVDGLAVAAATAALREQLNQASPAGVS